MSNLLFIFKKSAQLTVFQFQLKHSKFHLKLKFVLFNSNFDCNTQIVNLKSWN